MGAGGFFPEVKQLGSEADHSLTPISIHLFLLLPFTA
jgi:hypothetical protein